MKVQEYLTARATVDRRRLQAEHEARVAASPRPRPVHIKPPPRDPVSGLRITR